MVSRGVGPSRPLMRLDLIDEEFGVTLIPDLAGEGTRLSGDVRESRQPSGCPA